MDPDIFLLVTIIKITIAIFIFSKIINFIKKISKATDIYINEHNNNNQNNNIR